MHRFPAELVFDNANAVLADAAASQAGAERVYDLSACTHFDSSLLVVLLELMRRAQAAGARCRFEGASENLRRLAGLYGVASILFGAPAGAGPSARSDALFDAPGNARSYASGLAAPSVPAPGPK